MAQTCKTCKHPKVRDINKMLVAGIALRTITEQFGLGSHVSVKRHKESCLPQLLVDEHQNTLRSGLLKDLDDAKQRIYTLEATYAPDSPLQSQLVQRRFQAIDIEAKLAGEYTKDKENPQTAADFASELAQRLVDAHGWDADKAREFAEMSSQGVEPVKGVH